ncbi:helix-turn-helix transcriptional regulator [Streptomyces montanisoli]|uniref:Response regulator transcription factor n=1 Tax=Streptomyces montanisoli TaxID=2798581 RepID=A0A940MDC0_9ACTN|nr:LuxR C-terminal-related transcriptional regulator [Streptomyces montanisoli]MBP0456603.1 response regulator transcription factor [Streptomyces montanisoli]
MSAVLVHPQASDRLTTKGLEAELRRLEPAEVSLVESAAQAEVVVHASHVLSGGDLCLLRAEAERHRARLVLVAGRIPGIGLSDLVTCRIHAVLRLAEADGETILGAARAARQGDGVFPPSLQGSLVAQLSHLQEEVLRRAGHDLSGLNPRDVEVLRLISEGFGTRAIAHKLAYSERTVKNAVQSITMQLGARNRAQAVAHAVREGLF